ncbi:uncharacterized protein LOC112341763 isoform X2 [Selaginella moellendorffii]|uniref:uncharacterized protein LOC112341763 isoform X2 n=1 Tax=Selaginella moellendorffii TaxID=88036 RepID=UPI000D1C3BAD|nr:uncharacterized protein LOC112341763 isoform X2 [Selaginella moellendorffii]|eukprot:XP_024518169.1 uncharacterized protein LOC112341763 isoform X2 [Selaginella moellendorffii]
MLKVANNQSRTIKAVTSIPLIGSRVPLVLSAHSTWKQTLWWGTPLIVIALLPRCLNIPVEERFALLDPLCNVSQSSMENHGSNKLVTTHGAFPETKATASLRRPPLPVRPAHGCKSLCFTVHSVHSYSYSRLAKRSDLRKPVALVPAKGCLFCRNQRRKRWNAVPIYEEEQRFSGVSTMTRTAKHGEEGMDFFLFSRPGQKSFGRKE